VFESLFRYQVTRARRSTDQDTRLRTERLGVQIPAGIPFRAIVQRTGRSPPKAEIPVQVRMARPGLRGGGREARHFPVTEDYASSNLVHRAIFTRLSSSGRMADSQSADASSTLASLTTGVSSSGQDARLSIARREFDPLRPCQCSGSKLMRMSSRLLTGRQPVLFRRDPPGSWQVAQRSCGWLLTSAMEVRILSCQPIFGSVA
jgi:hypothetical protein